MQVLIAIIALMIVGFLGWNLFRRFGSDRLSDLNDIRRASSRLVSKGEFVDGNRHLGVALAVTKSTLFYENNDMKASVDLQWIREVEYDTELATGARVGDGVVLRLRSDSQTFEFVLPDEGISQWHVALPARGRTPLTATGA
jgi:hypothetical protein